MTEALSLAHCGVSGKSTCLSSPRVWHVYTMKPIPGSGKGLVESCPLRSFLELRFYHFCTYLLQLFAHLICFCNQWHQFDVVLEHSQDTGSAFPSPLFMAPRKDRREGRSLSGSGILSAMNKPACSLLHRSVIHLTVHQNIYILNL